MVHVTEKLTFKIYFILTNFNLNSHMWIVVTILDSTVLKTE